LLNDLLIANTLALIGNLLTCNGMLQMPFQDNVQHSVFRLPLLNNDITCLVTALLQVISDQFCLLLGEFLEKRGVLQGLEGGVGVDYLLQLVPEDTAKVVSTED
jgi:hypothetical protein